MNGFIFQNNKLGFKGTVGFTVGGDKKCDILNTSVTIGHANLVPNDGFAEKFTVFQEKKPFLNDNSSYKKDFFVQGQDVANGALYSFASAGILGLIIYFSIIFLLIFLLYKILVNFDKNYSYIKSSDIYFKYSSLVSLILILRSFLENGFMVWGIDQLFFILCASYVCNYYYFFKQKNL